MKAKDLMVPIEEYAKVECEASLFDALTALQTAQRKLPEGKAPHRAVLVEDAAGTLVGNVGRLGFIRALGEAYSTPGAREEMDKAGLSPGSISTVMDHVQFLSRNRGSLRERARSIKVCNVMLPVGESIDEEASLQEAIELFGAQQTLSILVRRGGQIVGVLRLADLFQEIQNQIVSSEED